KGASGLGEHASRRVRNRNVQRGQLLREKLGGYQPDRGKKSRDCSNRSLRHSLPPTRAPPVPLRPAGQERWRFSRIRPAFRNVGHLNSYRREQQYYKNTTYTCATTGPAWSWMA